MRRGGAGARCHRCLFGPRIRFELAAVRDSSLVAAITLDGRWPSVLPA